jgi:hypothetical protein
VTDEQSLAPQPESEPQPNRYEKLLKRLGLVAIIIGAAGMLVRCAPNGRFFGGNRDLHVRVDPGEAEQVYTQFALAGWAIVIGVALLIIY